MTLAKPWIRKRMPNLNREDSPKIALYSTSAYERRPLFNRLKEIIYLSFFVIMSAVVSLIVMNLVTYPILIIVQKGTKYFTDIFILSVIALISLYVLTKLVSTIRYYIASGLSATQIIPQIIVGRIKALIIFITSLVFISMLIIGLYSLFSYNTRLIINLFS